jgi:hypothetical protein
MRSNFLSLSWATSRGRDTFGYNIARLDSRATGRRYRTCGGGYDMIGTVLGEWLESEHQDRLRAIADRAGSYYSKTGGYHSHRTADGRGPDFAYLYGMTRNDDTGAVTLDGGCGRSSMECIAQALGLSLSAVCNRRGHVTGYMVTDHGSAEALQAAA